MLAKTAKPLGGNVGFHREDDERVCWLSSRVDAGELW
jgi:hypothetical protein